MYSQMDFGRVLDFDLCVFNNEHRLNQYEKLLICIDLLVLFLG